MPEENEVKDVDTEELPADESADNETVKTEEKETPESSEQKKPDQEGIPEIKEELRGRQSKEEEKEVPGELKDVDGETPRERALRLEVTRLKRASKDKMSDGMFKDSPTVEPKEISPDKKAVLEKYNPDELNNLKEVLNVMADDLGFVKKDDYQKSSYQTQSKDILDSFLDSHPEYLPENDKDNVLWNRFQEEYAIYKPPQNPRDFKRLFEKIHKEIFNISSDDSLKKVNAGKEKIKVASHASNSSNTNQNKPQQSNLDPNLKSYMKGFDEKELGELFGE